MTRPIVFCSLEAWDEVWRRNQFFVSGLLAHDSEQEILFVEPAHDLLFEIVSRRIPHRGAGLRGVPDVAGGRLKLYTPTKYLPRRAGRFAEASLLRSLRSAVDSLGWGAPILWINDPGWADLLRATQWPAIYDITDDWLEADRGARAHARLVQNEQTLMDLCQEVIVCSPGLAKSKGAQRAVTLIRNAVDVEKFQLPVDRPADLPVGDIALYAGTLHEDRLDVDLVSEVGTRLAERDASLVLLGPNALGSRNSARLAANRGIEVLGARPHNAIPGYLQHAGVLVVPHVVDDFTASLDPIKLYEYEAVGRPIVSTPVAGFRELSGHAGVVIARGEHFVSAIEQRLGTETAEAPHFDGIPDWGMRVAEVTAALERLGPAR